MRTFKILYTMKIDINFLQSYGYSIDPRNKTGKTNREVIQIN